MRVGATACVAPSGLERAFWARVPWANAHGFTLSPLRGWRILTAVASSRNATEGVPYSAFLRRRQWRERAIKREILENWRE